MKLSYLLLVCISGVHIFPACADEVEWSNSWDGAVYAYQTNTELRTDSLLNPNNQIVRLSQQSQITEARFNVKVEHESLRLTLRPIMLWQQNSNSFGDQIQNETYLSQGQLRWSVAESWNVAAGREVMYWGPGQFRSPSNPFYFDNGRSNPIRELSGLDAVKISLTPDAQHSISLAYIGSSGHYEGTTDTWRDTWILRATKREAKWSSGLAFAKKKGQQIFAGIDIQYTLNDAVLLYGEAGSSTRRNALQSPSAISQPFSVETESSRHLNELIGAAYTFENGQSLSAEYLHQGHGYTNSEVTAYFARVSSATLPAGAATLGMALANAPPLLGRDYLHLLWQNNVLESNVYWRMMLTHSLTDSGSQLSGYSEFTLSRRVSGFVLAVLPLGNEQQEFSSLFSSMATAGIKVALH